MRTNSWRFFITPFLDNGTYGSEIEVTQDVEFSSIGNIQLAFDNSEYDVGILRNSSVALTLRNQLGTYSDVDVLESIFRRTRANSKVRITYGLEENPNYAGMMVAGQSVLSVDTTIFSGLLDDSSAQMDIQNHLIPFTVLGYESLFDSTAVPFASLSNGAYITATILALLNQTKITNYLTVSGGNIAVGNDQTVDDISSYQNKTVKDALNDLLLVSSSILYIQNSTVYVKARTAGVTSKKTFYGQAAFNGIENIISIDTITSGFARIFNYLTWQSDPTIIVQDTGSINIYNVQPKVFGVSFFTTAAKIRALLAVFLAEFKTPKQEFILTAAVDVNLLSFGVLDRVTLDYPLMVVPASIGLNLPICGLAICGSAVTPRRLSNFAVDPPTDYKITNIEIDIAVSKIKFKLRKI